MKKTISLIMSVVLVLSLAILLSGCANSKIVGVYEMTDISGSITYNGTTTKLSKDQFEYYTVELKSDGKAIVKSKASGTTGQSIETEGTWTESDGVIKVKTTQNNVSVIEEMQWKDDVITYTTKQSASGTTIEMTLTLKKKTADKSSD